MISLRLNLLFLEHFGYWVDPKDPRFDVFVKRKAEEDKKIEEEAKKKALAKTKLEDAFKKEIRRSLQLDEVKAEVKEIPQIPEEDVAKEEEVSAKAGKAKEKKAKAKDAKYLPTKKRSCHRRSRREVREGR